MSRKYAVQTVRGMSLIEVALVLLIVGLLTTVFVATLSGMKGRDRIDRGVQMVFDDLQLIRSRAVSANATHRLNFLSSVEWNMEIYDEDAAAWTKVGETRQMPQDTYLTSDALANAGSNLESTARGLFNFQNSATGDPYITVTGLGATRTKSIFVDVGGAIDARSE